MTEYRTAPVTTPGVYDIDIDDYHSQRCCIGPSISSGGLRTILATCPAFFFAYSDLNPKRVTRETAALSFGRAAHALVLGEPEFNAKFVIAPFDDFRTKEARLWRDEQTRQIVRAPDMEIIEQMTAAQRASAQCMHAFKDGVAEKSIIWKDEETGIWLKSRPDWLPQFPAIRYTTEYKTAVTIKPRLLSAQVFKYGYEIQAALSLDAIEIVMGTKPLGLAHVVQEKIAPFLVDLRLFSDEQIAWGRLQYRHALRIFARCVESGHWPAYTENPQFFETPHYIVKEMESFDADDNRHETKEFDAAEYLAAG